MNIISKIQELKNAINNLSGVINNIINSIHFLKGDKGIVVDDITNKKKRTRLNYDPSVFTLNTSSNANPPYYDYDK